MALQSNAALLDELMGKYRNVAPGANVNQVRFSDDEVCKYYLVEFCPHDLFVNTRADLGPCTKIHDDELKKQYEKSSRFGRLGYEEEYERFLRSLLNEVERKIRRGNERLQLTQMEPNSDKRHPLDSKRERAAELREKINALIKEAESLGEEGRIEEAQRTLDKCEVFKSEYKGLEILDLAFNNTDNKQMEVCNICGSFLIINDAQSRIEEHNMGKQHQGYAKLRTAWEDIRKKRLEELEKREKEREMREKEREKERDRHHRDRHRDRRDRRSSRSPSNRHLSKRNGSSSSLSSKDRDRERRSDHRSKRTRSRSRSKERKHLKAENGADEHKSKQIEKETDEFLKLADNLVQKAPRDEEKEEGEADDD